MRICLYTETALPQMGGQEMVVDTLARTYQALGHDVVVLAPRPHSAYRARDEQFPYAVVRHPRFISSRFFVSWYRWFLLRLWRRVPCDVLHCHGLFPPGYLGSLTRAALDVPMVITSHGGDLHPDNIRLRKPGVREKIIRGLESADALIAISRFTAEGYNRLCPWAKRVADIPNGVDLQAFVTPTVRPAGLDPAIKPGRYLLFLGRLRHRKGVDLLLRALAGVAATGEVKLVIAGDGTERGMLETVAAQLGLSDRVRFVGCVAGPTKTYLLQNALCGVVPSRISEAFPLVVLEMFAAGKAVIGTRIPGLEDLLDDGIGWCVRAESASALSAALADALASPAKVRGRGAAAQDIAAGYDWTVIARRHLDLYEELLAQRGHGGEVRYARVRADLPAQRETAVWKNAADRGRKSRIGEV